MSETATELDFATRQMAAEVLAGLRERPKRIHCKYLYDEEGSRLFDRICELPEYYPTRTELALLERRLPEVAAALGPGCLLIEYGSGSSVKTRLLLESLDEIAGYVPIDISAEHLERTVERLRRDFPALLVQPVAADYTAPVPLPPLPPARRRVVFFPGSTIGNFEPREAVELLDRMRQRSGPDGRLLIGVDLRKERAILEPAYDDRAGVTADFNLNLLRRFNRELDADFDLGAFAHRARWNADAGRVEIELVSRRRQTVSVAGEEIDFAAGESIATESSYKHTPEGFAELARQAGCEVRRVWCDERRWFSVQLLAARG